MRCNISDRSGSQALQDHPAAMTCLPITERFKRMSGLQHFRKFWKIKEDRYTEGESNFNDSIVLNSCFISFIFLSKKKRLVSI